MGGPSLPLPLHEWAEARTWGARAAVARGGLEFTPISWCWPGRAARGPNRPRLLAPTACLPACPWALQPVPRTVSGVLKAWSTLSGCCPNSVAEPWGPGKSTCGYYRPWAATRQKSRQASEGTSGTWSPCMPWKSPLSRGRWQEDPPVPRRAARVGEGAGPASGS